MPETEEDSRLFDALTTTEELPLMMAMNLDLDGFWSFDPSPSFIVPSPERSLSPLWGSSDDNNNNELNDGNGICTVNDTLTFSGTAHRHLTESLDQVTNKPSNNDMKKQLPVPILYVNPSEFKDATCVIKERLTMALRYYIELGEKHVLAQVWAPVKNKGRTVLTTSGQPFVLDPNCTGLQNFRMASLMYTFSVDDETDGVLEIPGRVFRQKLPEWTPDVRFYNLKECQRVIYAEEYDVRGTLALPVFEPSGQSCVAVLELTLTTQKINYAQEVDKLCKALEAVNLKSSNIMHSLNTQMCNESRQQALAEILEVMAVVCETYSLPLAQTWVPCRQQSVLEYGGGFKKSHNSFDGTSMGQVCMSTTDVAFYVFDAHMWGFREASAEHHLKKGQGVAGRAFETRSSCICENITHFGKTEYPLVHYGRLFGLVGSFAICLRSAYTNDDDYVLEFFLPPTMVDYKAQQKMLGSLLTSMKQHFRSLKVASGEEIGEDGRFVEIIRASVDSDVIDPGIHSIQQSNSVISNGGPLIMGSNQINNEHCGKSETETVETIKKSENKQAKAEKSISLDVLQQHSAKNPGVCPTTMRRISREHGISRWPSCMINKEAGLNFFHAQELIPYDIINGLKSARDKIAKALEIICGSHNLSLAQVWIAYEDKQNVPFPSSLEEPQTTQMLVLKLTGYLNITRPGPSFWDIGEYYKLCDIVSPETGELALQTLQDHKSRYISKFCPNYLMSHDAQLDLAQEDNEISALAICLRCNDTGDFDYAFEFLWPKHSNYAILMEALLSTVKRCLPSFKFPSGAELGDELDVIVVENSRDKEDDEDSEDYEIDETEKFKLFQGKKSLTVPKTPEERHKPSIVVDHREHTKGKYKTATISLPREVIEKQFGKTMKEAAKNLHVSLSTLKRKCNDHGISEWPGPKLVKRKIKDSRIIQIDTNEKDSGTMQDLSIANMNKSTLTIKAEYADDILKFHLPVLQATFANVEKQIGLKLKLGMGTYNIKYLDEDGDWISLVSDEEMGDCIKCSTKSDRVIIRLRVLPSMQ